MIDSAIGLHQFTEGENMNDKYIDGLVSVIIPTYNSEKYLEKTVFSVLDQSYSNIEIVLVDDCSKDSTRDVIESISKKDHRVRYHFQEKNEGAAVARNTGIRCARGRYIAFLDSDDIWEPNKLDKQIPLVNNGNPFVFCAFDTVDENSNRIQNKIKIKGIVSYKDLMTKTYISTPTVVYDRFFYGDVEMPLRRTGQDYAFWLVLLKQSDAVGIDEALVHVTRRGGSLSKNKLQSLRDVYEVQTKFEGINSFIAGVHTVRYLFYALKKKLID